MKKQITLFLLVSILGLTSCNNEAPKGELSRTINIYALNDFHGSFLYDESYKQAGLSRIGNFLMEEKKNDPDNTFIISSGDMFQGGAESNITKGEVVIEAMNAIGFDSMTIGNHEFDWGTSTLIEMSKKMDFPLLGHNVYYSKNDQRPEFLKPYTIIEKSDYKVGIIGTIVPNANSSILATIAKEYNFPNDEEAILELADKLRVKEDCDIVLLSSHSGNEYAFKDLTKISETTNLPYVDAIFLGHEHDKKEGVLNGVPYVEGGDNGRYLSKITLELARENTKENYKVVNFDTENLYSYAKFTENSNIIDGIYDAYKDEIEPIRDEVLTTLDRSYTQSELGDILAKSILLEANKIYNNKISLALMNKGGVRNDMPSGKLTYGNLMKVYPFENTLCIVKITEAQYQEYTENYNFYNYYVSPTFENGYTYLATVDYVAYKYFENSIVESYNDITCRDLLANFIREGGLN